MDPLILCFGANLMPKASVTLPNGTTIEIDGTLEEVQALTEFYGRGGGASGVKPPPARQAAVQAGGGDDSDVLDIARVVAFIKDCDEAETIESRVLDQKDVLNRVLLCLWAVGKSMNDAMGLTSGDIEKITDQLGVKVGISNASTVLSGRAKAFVSGDSVRKQGGAVRYKLNRRGMQAFDAVLTGG